MSEFRNFDTKRADGAYVTFERVLKSDETTSPDDFDCYDADEKEAFNHDAWRFVGVVARAHIHVVRNYIGTYYRIDSAGLWGVDWHDNAESESYANEIFEEQKAALLADLKTFGAVTFC
jgi:hypothetical protein